MKSAYFFQVLNTQNSWTLHIIYKQNFIETKKKQATHCALYPFLSVFLPDVMEQTSFLSRANLLGDECVGYSGSRWREASMKTFRSHVTRGSRLPDLIILKALTMNMKTK